MDFELSPKHILEAEIAVVNGSLVALASRAIKSAPFSYVPKEREPLDDDYTRMVGSDDTSAFWAHHIGGHLTGADGLAELLEEHPEALDDAEESKKMIVDSQTDTFLLMQLRIREAYQHSTPLEQESYDAFLAAAFSFDWASNSELLNQLHVAVSILARRYTNLEGKPTFGQIIKKIGANNPRV